MMRRLANLALASASVLFVLCTAEAGLRIVTPPRPVADDVSFSQHHEILGWEKVPGVAGQRVTDEYVIREEINARGLRGPERPYEKAAGTRRVLALGDSFVEAYQVDEADLFTTLLEERLRAEAGLPPVEVINAGTTGYSTDQELLFFRHEGVRYQPDLTLLFFFLNDIWFNAATEIEIADEPEPARKPAFARGEDGALELLGVPVPPRAEIPPPRPATGLEAVKEGLRENSQLYNFATDRIKNSTALYSLAVRLGLARRPQFGALSSGDEALPVPDVYRVWQRALLPEVERAWQITEAVLVALRDEAAQAGSAFAVFYVPAIVEVDDALWADTRRKYGLEAGAWSPAAPRERLHEICGRHGIPLLDPTQRFRAEAEAGRLPYFLTDRHWNASGHRVVSEVLAAAVERWLADG